MLLKPLCQALALPEGPWTHEHDKSRPQSPRGVTQCGMSSRGAFARGLCTEGQSPACAKCPWCISDLPVSPHTAHGTLILGDPWLGLCGGRGGMWEQQDSRGCASCLWAPAAHCTLSTGENLFSSATGAELCAQSNAELPHSSLSKMVHLVVAKKFSSELCQPGARSCSWGMQQDQHTWGGDGNLSPHKTPQQKNPTAANLEVDS